MTAEAIVTESFYLSQPAILITSLLTGIDNEDIILSLEKRKQHKLSEDRHEDIDISCCIPADFEVISKIASELVFEHFSMLWKDSEEYEASPSEPWGGIIDYGDGLTIHDHSVPEYPLNFACVYYAKADEKSSPLCLLPNGWLPGFPAGPGPRENRVQVKTGQLVIFPAWMPHYVPVQTNKGELRAAMAFNLTVNQKSNE